MSKNIGLYSGKNLTDISTAENSHAIPFNWVAIGFMPTLGSCSNLRSAEETKRIFQLRWTSERAIVSMVLTMAYSTAASFLFIFNSVNDANFFAGYYIFLRHCVFFTRDSRSAKRVLAVVILSVRLRVCLSRPGTDSNPGEIETPGFRPVIA